MANEAHDRVKVGQIWAENPKSAFNRLLKIERCENGYAYCQEGCAQSTGYTPHKGIKIARIRMDRMKPVKFTLWRGER